jgi:hypothetical protein
VVLVKFKSNIKQINKMDQTKLESQINESVANYELVSDFFPSMNKLYENEVKTTN